MHCLYHWRRAANEIAHAGAIVFGNAGVKHFSIETTHGTVPPSCRVLDHIVHGQAELLGHAVQRVALGNFAIGGYAVNQRQLTLILFATKRAQMT